MPRQHAFLKRADGHAGVEEQEIALCLRIRHPQSIQLSFDALAAGDDAPARVGQKGVIAEACKRGAHGENAGRGHAHAGNARDHVRLRNGIAAAHARHAVDLGEGSQHDHRLAAAHQIRHRLNRRVIGEIQIRFIHDGGDRVGKRVDETADCSRTDGGTGGIVGIAQIHRARFLPDGSPHGAQIMREFRIDGHKLHGGAGALRILGQLQESGFGSDDLPALPTDKRTQRAQQFTRPGPGDEVIRAHSLLGDERRLQRVDFMLGIPTGMRHGAVQGDTRRRRGAVRIFIPAQHQRLGGRGCLGSGGSGLGKRQGRTGNEYGGS